MKTLLILVDGMRPDAIQDLPIAKEIFLNGAYSMKTATVMPSVTLPCHMSLFHSVDPSRHGTTTNTYAPQVRPVKGLCEVLHEKKKRCAFFTNWAELRDLARPGSLAFSYFSNGEEFGYEQTNKEITDAAIDYLQTHDTDFAFLYLGLVDAVGHRYGWMSPEYMDAVQSSFENIKRVLSVLPSDYTVFITADHGGHGRSHGCDLPEDMTIPLIILGENLQNTVLPENCDIKDIAPTVTALLGVEPDEEWEGKKLL